MDLEGYVHRSVRSHKSREEIIAGLIQSIRSIKREDPTYIRELAEAVYEEAVLTGNLEDPIFRYQPAGVSMGDFGVGSRGTGDFYAHKKIAEIIGKTGACVGVDQMDDGGVVEEHGNYIVCTVDGMHSRLSDFPFLAAFHVTRATLRDCYVMGARPVMLFSDIHAADDADVAKIFDYTAGIVAISEVTGVPLVSGSTLRIGGDMVIGDRMTGCVGCVGVAEHLTSRKQARPGDLILMTEGSGGGTIATTAIYSGSPEVVQATLNIRFLTACKTLLENPQILQEIHAMTDVTNGGLRGDIYEMARTAQCRMIIREDTVHDLIDPAVSAMLNRLQIDPLGVSLDALLIVVPGKAAESVMSCIQKTGITIREIGYVEEGESEALLEKDKKRRPFIPEFRESAYTPVKRVVDQYRKDFSVMQKGIDSAALSAIEKKNQMIRHLSNSSAGSFA
ncbi:MAG: hypothetical protein JXA44_09400 [Methanospirillaceae archaeon]|nr:hypothetical protein [Methanospirillaceae archaeon]